ncbi:MAG: hypothetical protein AAFZ65_15090 [Planctomycetota bacterium]
MSALGGVDCEFRLETFSDEQQAEIRRDPDIERRVGKGAIGYEVANPDPFGTTRVRVAIDHVIDPLRFDAIGFPLYSDLVVRSLALNLRLAEPLRPVEDAITVQADLIRRTSFVPTKLFRDFDPPTLELGDGHRTYHFGPLLRPIGGYFYCFSWRALLEAESQS